MIKLPSIATQWQRPRPAPVKPVLRAVRYPYGPEQLYAAALLFEAKGYGRAVRVELLPRLPSLLTYAGQRLPRVDDLGDRMFAAIAELRSAFGVSTKAAKKWAGDMVRAVSVVHADDFVNAYGGKLTVNPMVGAEKWLPDAMSVALDQNVALIKSVPEDLLDDVKRLVGDAVQRGTRVEELGVQIMDRTGVAERRALFIARDQVGKWHGALNQHRQLDAGVAEYDWATVGDERVRKSHQARNGKRYSWAGSETKPGEEVMCRCSPVPVIPDWED